MKVHLLDDINNINVACGISTIRAIFNKEDYQLTEEKVNCNECIDIINRRK